MKAIVFTLLLWPLFAMTTDKRLRILALKPNKGLALHE